MAIATPSLNATRNGEEARLRRRRIKYLLLGVGLLVLPLLAQYFGNAWVRILEIALHFRLNCGTHRVSGGIVRIDQQNGPGQIETIFFTFLLEGLPRQRRKFWQIALQRLENTPELRKWSSGQLVNDYRRDRKNN